MNEKTRKTALKALDEMTEVINNEMLLHGRYVTEAVECPDLAAAGAACGGRRACAVGALFLGAGVKAKGLNLPGAFPHERPGFLAHRPGLRLAYDALNKAAAKKHPRLLARVAAESDDYHYDENDREISQVKLVGALEALFESGYLDPSEDQGTASRVEQRKLLAIIDVARQEIEAA